LQVVLGWTDSHLHQFLVGGQYYAQLYPGYDVPMVDERRIQLRQLVPGPRSAFRYEYDFGDS
jgi:hypothetical protein